MNPFTSEGLKALMAGKSGYCVSLFLPTHSKGGDTQQDPIRLKNLLKDAEDRLVQKGMKSFSAKALLKPAQDLVSDTRFWSHQSDGLAIFMSPTHLSIHSVPFNFDELVIVADRFHVKPLLPLLSGDGRFYVLALSQNQVRLLQGTRFSMDEIDLEDMPTSLSEALQYDVMEKPLKWHAPRQKASSGKTGIFHGHGGGIDNTKEDILQFLRRIDKGLRDVIGSDGIPLVLAAVEYLIPMYKEANTYPHLLEKGISGNPEGLTSEDLHSQAWNIVEPHFKQAQQEAVDRYYSLVGTGKTAQHLDSIIRAAYSGQIDTLFVPIGLQRWGDFDPENLAVRIHDEPMADDEDLLDFAAIQTILNSGTVFAVEPENVPDDRYVAAILRY